MRRKLNIMIITQSLSGGGAEKLAANLSLGLRGLANVVIVTYWESNQEYDFYGKRINLDLLGKTSVGKVFTAIKRIHIIRLLKRKYNIDCSISYVPPCDYVNVLSKRKNERTIIDVVSNMSTVFPKGLSKAFRKWVLNSADYLVTVSEGVREDIIKNFDVESNKSSAIYNSCDIDAINDAISKKAGMDQIQVDFPDDFIVSMGSFRWPKGHWHLIKAFYSIKDKIPGIKLVILGDGEYRSKYEELIEKLGISDRVILPGFINPPHYIISRAKAFVFSSVFEGFGNALIEAMACGVPVISTDCKYGPREVLAPGTPLSHVCSKTEICEYGIITPPSDVSDIDVSSAISSEELEMGKGILIMLENKEMMNSYRSKGLEHCRSFDNNNITKLWLKIIEELTEND